MKPLTPPDGDPMFRIVSMIEHKGRILVATDRGVYYIEGDKLMPLLFVNVPMEAGDADLT